MIITMFKSKEEAYLKPSSFKGQFYILGIGIGLLFFYSSLKSEIIRTVPLLFGIINVGAAHSGLIFTFLNTSVY